MTLLDTDQAAEFLRLKPSTLVDWRWQRKGPPWIRISRGSVRYSQEALESWVNSKTVEELPQAS